MHTGFFAVLIALCSMSVGCAQPLVGGAGESSERGIVGGTPTTDWDSVVFIFTGETSCTGVVVHPDVVLTSGQCLDGTYGTVEVYWGDDLVQGPNDWTRYSNDYYLHPYYNPTDYSGDIAAIRLSEPSPTDPIPINCDPPDASWVDPADPLTGVGFGSAVPDPLEVGVKMEAPIAFESWDSDFLLHADQAHGFCTGDTGAPVLTDHSGDWAVAAVASHGDAQCVGWGAATRTDPHVDWLEGLFPGWDVCGPVGDDDDSASDDDTAGDDDSASDDDTADDDTAMPDDDDDTGDDDVGFDDDTGTDCACRTAGAGGGSAGIAVLGLLLLAVRRRCRIQAVANRLPS